MNKMILIPILVGITIIFSLVLFYPELESSNNSKSDSENDFIYSDIDKIQKILVTKNIFISTPTPITDHTVEQYCTFFDDENIQKFVQYCLTTAISDSEGQHLGNLNMGGNPINPKMALAIIEVPSLDYKLDDSIIIFQTIIDTLVCDCWDEQQPGGFESVSAWINAANQQYDESEQKTLKSKINGLAQKQLVLEITATEESYLWTLIVIK
jgi:hypothetical protein